MKKTLAKLIATVTTIALVVAAPLTVFAEENKFGSGDDTQVENEEAQAYYKSQVERLEQMKKEKVNITMEHHGAYVAKSSILYAAKIVGVRDNGEYIVTWEKVDDRSGLCVGNNKTVTLPGNYIGFAYSLDIRWGTDWPYKDTFWYNTDKTVKNINISYGGTCRRVSIKITVDGTTVVNNSNCKSH